MSLMSPGSIAKNAVKEMLGILIGHSVNVSQWRYVNSIGFELNVAPFAGEAVAFGGELGGVFLARGQEPKVEPLSLQYIMGSGSWTVKIPLEFVSGSISSTDLPSAGVVTYEHEDFESPNQFEGPCVALSLDGAALVLAGGSLTMMLVGINPELPKLISNLVDDIDELNALVKSEPKGIRERAIYAMKFPFKVARDEARIAADIGSIMCEFKRHGPSRGVIWMAGTKATTSNLVVDLSIALTGHAGSLKVVPK